MYENSVSYTWWDVEDNVGSLASQAVSRWEQLGLPKDAVGHPVTLRAWTTDGGGIVYTITLYHKDVEVHTVEGVINISGVSPGMAAMAAENTIYESAVNLTSESIAEKLVEGLLSWLRQ